MGLFDIFHRNKPERAGEKYLNQIGPMAEQRLNPYVQRGNEAGNNLYGQYQNLTNNPGDLYNQLMSGYSHSKGFETRQQNALQAQQNSAAAGGYAGTPEDQRRQAEISDALLGADMDTYFRNVSGLYNTGLEGQQGFEKEGYNSNYELTNLLANLLSQRAGIETANAKSKNAGKKDTLSMLTSLLGGAVGGVVGGPTGAYAGAQFGSNIW